MFVFENHIFCFQLLYHPAEFLHLLFSKGFIRFVRFCKMCENSFHIYIFELADSCNGFYRSFANIKPKSRHACIQFNMHMGGHTLTCSHLGNGLSHLFRIDIHANIVL